MYQMDKHTVALLHFDGELKDESGKIWTPQNGATIDSSQSKFGRSSLYLDGKNQYLLTLNNDDFNFGTGDFTIDWWQYTLAIQSGSCIFSTHLSPQQGYPSLLVGYQEGDHAYAFSTTQDNDTRPWNILNSLDMGYISIGTWDHYALVRFGSTFYTFKNGMLVSSKSSDEKIGICINPVLGKYYVPYTNSFKGYIDEFRISKIARWTADFPLPTEPTKPSIGVPTNLTATAGDSKVTLSWTAAIGATAYNVKRSTTAGGPYTTVGANVTGTNYVDAIVTNGTTYYYVVTAVDAAGESGNSNEDSATPKSGSVTPPTPVGNALLRVTMIDSSEREYRLSLPEVDGFAKWYDRTVGTGNTCYIFDDIIDNSKEYLSFEKIISFKVIPLAK